MKAEPDWHSGLSLAVKQLPKIVKKPIQVPASLGGCCLLGTGAGGSRRAWA